MKFNIIFTIIISNYKQCVSVDNKYKNNKYKYKDKNEKNIY